MIEGTRTGVTTITTPSDREVEVTRIAAAPRQLVWDAWTRPEHVPNWLTGPEGWTLPVCEMDLRAGGAWRYVWRKGDGEEMEMSGTFLEVSPPERLVHTESWGPDWPETVNTLVLTEHDGQTTMTLTLLYPSKEARDAAMKTGMDEGMEQSYAKLDRLLETLA